MKNPPSPPPTDDLTLREYLRQVAGYAVLGLVLLIVLIPLGKITFSLPTAAIVRAMLAGQGYTVAGTLAHVKMGDFPMRYLQPWWTAAPAFALGAAAILAYPTDRGHKILGLVQIWFHTVLFNAMILGWLAAQPDPVGMDTALANLPQVTTYAIFSAQIRLVYPPAMTLVLALSLLFWMVRIVPRPLYGRGTLGWKKR